MELWILIHVWNGLTLLLFTTILVKGSRSVHVLLANSFLFVCTILMFDSLVLPFQSTFHNDY